MQLIGILRNVFSVLAKYYSINKSSNITCIMHRTPWYMYVCIHTHTQAMAKEKMTTNITCLTIHLSFPFWQAENPIPDVHEVKRTSFSPSRPHTHPCCVSLARNGPPSIHAYLRGHSVVAGHYSHSSLDETCHASSFHFPRRCPPFFSTLARARFYYRILHNRTYTVISRRGQQMIIPWLALNRSSISVRNERLSGPCQLWLWLRLRYQSQGRDQGEEEPSGVCDFGSTGQ